MQASHEADRFDKRGGAGVKIEGCKAFLPKFQEPEMASNSTASVTDPLQDVLYTLSRQPMGARCRTAILNAFWNRSSSTESLAVPLDIYVEYFEEQCRLALHNWERYDISNIRFYHLVEIVGMIHERKSRMHIESHLKTILECDCREVSSEIVDLSVRLLLMIQTGSYRQVLIPGQASLSWTDGAICHTLSTYFSHHNVLKDTIELDKAFTARNIERISGIRIVWTGNLLDHLRLSEDDSSLTIFHHASFLHCQRSK